MVDTNPIHGKLEKNEVLEILLKTELEVRKKRNEGNMEHCYRD